MIDPKQFFAENPDVETLEAFVVDVSGILRGKKMPRQNADKLFKGGVRMPRSAFAVDIWGQDVPAAQLIIETGDNDGVCYPVKNSLRMVPWLKNTAQVMLTMKEPDGRPFFGDSRQVLKKIVGLYAKKGWTPVVAAELEFYLLDAQMDERGNPQPPLSPVRANAPTRRTCSAFPRSPNSTTCWAAFPRPATCRASPPMPASRKTGPGSMKSTYITCRMRWPPPTMRR